MQINSINNINFTSHHITKKELQNLKQSMKEGSLMSYNVDTTHGFMDQELTIRPDGTRDGFPVIGADKIVPVMQDLKDAMAGRIFRFETVDAHTFADPEIQVFKQISDIHSEKYTKGAEMIPETVWGKPNAVIEVEPEKADVPTVQEIQKIKNKNGIIRLEKNETTPLKYGDANTGEVVENKKAVQLFKNLKKAGVKIALLTGVAEEYCVKDAAAACKKFGITPVIVEDAVKDAGTPVLKDRNDPVYKDVATITSSEVKEWLA